MNFFLETMTSLIKKLLNFSRNSMYELIILRVELYISPVLKFDESQRS